MAPTLRARMQYRQRRGGWGLGRGVGGGGQADLFCQIVDMIRLPTMWQNTLWTRKMHPFLCIPFYADTKYWSRRFE